MQRRLDTPEGRARYGRRFATVEPVFANLRHNKRLDRFTLRGRARWMRSGSSSAWCTTSRSSPTTATPPNGAQGGRSAGRLTPLIVSHSQIVPVAVAPAPS